MICPCLVFMDQWFIVLWRWRLGIFIWGEVYFARDRKVSKYSSDDDNRRARILSQLEETALQLRRRSQHYWLLLFLLLFTKTTQTEISFRIIETNEILHVELLVTTKCLSVRSCKYFHNIEPLLCDNCQTRSDEGFCEEFKDSPRRSPLELTRQESKRWWNDD